MILLCPTMQLLLQKGNNGQENKSKRVLITPFFIPTDVNNLCGKIRIRKSRHYGGQVMQTNRAIFSAIAKGSDYLLSLDDKS